MNEYYLIIKTYDNEEDYYSIDITYKTFDEKEAEKIANILTRNIENFKGYILLKKEYNLIKEKK